MVKFVTIRDIAMAAGVSPTTVSYAISGKTAGVNIPLETRERILSIVRQSGYKPNRVARDMVLGRQTTIGLVLSAAGSGGSAALIPAVASVLAAAGFRLVVIAVPADLGAAREAVTSLLHDGIAGLLCCPTAMSVTVTAVAGMCPVMPLVTGAAETLLKALGAPVPVMAVPMEGEVHPSRVPEPVTTLTPEKPIEPALAPPSPRSAVEPVKIIEPAVPPQVAARPEPIPATPVHVVTEAPLDQPLESVPEPTPQPVTEPVDIAPAPEPPAAPEPTLDVPATNLDAAVAAAASSDGGVIPVGSEISPPEVAPLPAGEPVVVPAPAPVDPDPPPVVTAPEIIEPPPVVPMPEPVVLPGPAISPESAPTIVPEPTPAAVPPVEIVPSPQAPEPTAVEPIPGTSPPQEEPVPIQPAPPVAETPPTVTIVDPQNPAPLNPA